MLKIVIEALEIIVPHEENKNYYKKVLENGESDSTLYFENGTYKFGYSDSNRSFLLHNKENIFEYVFYDLLTEEYLKLSRKIKNKDDLWTNLSGLLINYERDDLRKKLDFNIYDNKDYVFDLESCSTIFEDENTVVFELKIDNDQSIGLTSRLYFNQLKEMLKSTKLKIKELK